MNASEINWDVSPEDGKLIAAILNRALGLGLLRRENAINTEMDIIATHNHNVKLRLADWLAADDFNFKHDLLGIDRHMNRDTGKLGGHFLPRFAVREGDAA